jgi:hypothetical protein
VLLLLLQVVAAMRDVAQQRSVCRLALTGYPLQNNLEEYGELIRWVSGRECKRVHILPSTGQASHPN